MTASTVLQRSQLGSVASLCAASAMMAGIILAWSAPARAGDDGQAPIWDSLGGLVSFGMTPPNDPIDYRERGKLVLPPKVELPPPAAPAQKVAAWPNDPDLLKVQKKREFLKTYVTRSPSHDNADGYGRPLRPDQLKSEGAALDSGSGDARCRRDPAECSFIGASLLEKMGIIKEKDTVVAGEEPDREWLTDPPSGYRKVYSTTKATFDVQKRVDQSDPRTTYMPKTDQ
jgi:hypothetical protein